MSYIGESTVVGDELEPSTKSQEPAPTARANHLPGSRGGPQSSLGQKLAQNTFEYINRQFFIRIQEDGLIPALQKLDAQLQSAGHRRILSKKNPITWAGHEITAGRIGVVNHGGLPKVLTKAGRYPRFPLRNWWAREFHGTKGISDTIIEFLGLTIVQVSQNQAAVVCDPQNRVFIVRNGGFVAFAVEGSYSVLEVIDQTHLPKTVRDPVTKAILGHTHEVNMRSVVSFRGKSNDYVGALFLDVPANNCAILQRGDDLEQIGAGQHCITSPNVTLRGLFTCGENQLEMPTKDIFTRDQVPVALTIYLKWQLNEPLKLTTHGYNTPYEALRDKAQSILTQIVAHLDYSSMVKQRSLAPDGLQGANGEDDATAAFLDALRSRAMDELVLAALEYGITLKDLAVIDRQFKGDIATTMDKLTTRALQAQVEAANVDRENSNKVKQEEGNLQVVMVKAQQRKTQADAEAYTIVTQAKAKAEAVQLDAQAQATATRLHAQADADAIRTKAKAAEDVQDEFSREMELRRMEVSRVHAYGNNTVFVQGDAGSLGPSMAQGLAMARGFKAGDAPRIQ
ncbi:uncharacterized protein EI90DRAFT_3117391 [Cantharellus anzutake]|uniref:uncharacterized protein n=1 Tax=Cantharellus anzutake TaxID=1750568 RepID=UPI00190541AB|nr:uncharacterized protein EI90DRAFT_3117391 [Cantharellus anzutake]KAF8339581.1 hypothetical protein EI90DRAFT_3117391 [Cantharellus anzutake]